jgi:hypothetical protein
LGRIGTIINYPRFIWNSNNLIEQIYIDLISAKEKDGITRKYEKRAKWLIRRIRLFELSLPFIIYKMDLSYQVKKELAEIGKANYKYMKSLVNRAIEMIFEGLDETNEPIFNNRHYLLSIKRYNKLEWRFDKEEDKENDSDLKYEISYSGYNSEGIVIGKVKKLENKIIKEVNNIL